MPDKDVFADQAEALGITWSDKNHMRSLWDQYCSDVAELMPVSDSIDDASNKPPEQNKDLSRHLSGEQVIRDILKVLQNDWELAPSTMRQEQVVWLNEQITILNRLKGDLELGLRNASSEHGVQPNQL